MSKFTCRCGYVMNLSEGRPEYELALIPEACLEEIADRLGQLEQLTSESFYHLIDTTKLTVYHCPSCGRLHVGKGNGGFSSFIQELSCLHDTILVNPGS